MGSLRRPYIKARRVAPPEDKARILVAPMESREAAVQMELLLIRYWGRKESGGLLLNLTKGGAGLREPSAAAREKISQATKGRPRTEAWTANQIAANEWRTKRAEWLSPTGEVVFSYPREIARSYPEQCLGVRSLQRVFKGSLAHHKGWTPLSKALGQVVSKTKFQQRVWSHPDHGEVIAYTRELADRYGLQPGKLSMVARGQRGSHGGWKFVAVAVPHTLRAAA